MIRARKRFGQHFLESAWVDKVVRAIDPKPDETFIEIGPGRGALTRPLAARARHVVAFEIDRDLAGELRESVPSNVTIVEGDFLAASPSSLITPNPQSPITNDYRVAANLPYNIASPILFRLIDMYDAGLPLADATVMLQREVADRLLALPGRKEYGVLTVLIGHSARIERLLNLPAGAFRPAPKVLSSVVRLHFHPPDPPVKDRELFRRLVQTVFTQRRKTLANALRQLVPDTVPGTVPDTVSGTVSGTVNLSRRPETLTVAEFARLADVLTSR